MSKLRRVRSEGGTYFHAVVSYGVVHGAYSPDGEHPGYACLSLLKQHPSKDSIAMKRRSCGWSDKFLLETLTGTST